MSAPTPISARASSLTSFSGTTPCNEQPNAVEMLCASLAETGMMMACELAIAAF